VAAWNQKVFRVRRLTFRRDLDLRNGPAGVFGNQRLDIACGFSKAGKADWPPTFPSATQTFAAIRAVSFAASACRRILF